MRSKGGFRRVILDTNVVLSRLTHEHSVAGQAFERAKADGVLLVSHATLSELREVLARPKFDRYVSVEDRAAFLDVYEEIVEPVIVRDVICECRDPKDDRVLELALSGNADLIVTGDADLLALDPWRGVRILRPAEFVGAGG